MDYAAATHPHADHIGGMADVLNTFNIRNFYATAFTTTTQTYERMLDAVENSGAAVHEVMAGSVILDEPELLVEVVAPKTLSDDSSSSSVVIKLTYGENKFLFTGEDDIWTNIKCDGLKVGHHGSATSSSANFLKKVDPTYAVISCGMGNKYGHPTDEVLERLNSRNIEVFRTDLQGTIVFTSDGKNISVDKQPSAYQTSVQTTATTTQTTVQTTTTAAEVDPVGTQYILNTNTQKIHYPSCSAVKQMKDSNKAYTEDFDGAVASGYVPCKKCNPN